MQLQELLAQIDTAWGESNADLTTFINKIKQDIVIPLTQSGSTKAAGWIETPHTSFYLAQQRTNPGPPEVRNSLKVPAVEPEWGFDRIAGLFEEWHTQYEKYKKESEKKSKKETHTVNVAKTQHALRQVEFCLNIALRQSKLRSIEQMEAILAIVQKIQYYVEKHLKKQLENVPVQGSDEHAIAIEKEFLEQMLTDFHSGSDKLKENLQEVFAEHFQKIQSVTYYGDKSLIQFLEKELDCARLAVDFFKALLEQLIILPSEYQPVNSVTIPLVQTAIEKQKGVREDKVATYAKTLGIKDFLAWANEKIEIVKTRKAVLSGSVLADSMPVMPGPNGNNSDNAPPIKP